MTGRLGLALRWCAAALLVLSAPRPAGAARAEPPSQTDARIAYYRARVGGPGTYPAYARLGLAYLEKYRETGRNRSYEQALQSLRQSLAYQRNFEALLGMASVLFERHRFDEALPFALEALDTMPSSVEALGTVFDIRLARGDIAEAEAAARTLIEHQAGFHASSRQAALLEYRGDLLGAARALREARTHSAGLTPASQAWTEVRLGSIHLARCEASEAEAAYERARGLAPNAPIVREHVAELRAAQGRWSEARRLYEGLLATRPDPVARLALAETLAQTGDSRGARRATERSRAELRDAAREGARDGFRPLALLLLEGDADRAEGLRWARADWDLRKDAAAADTLAWALFRNGEREEARRRSAEAVRSGTRSSLVLLHAGWIRREAGEISPEQERAQRSSVCGLALVREERALMAWIEATGAR